MVGHGPGGLGKGPGREAPPWAGRAPACRYPHPRPPTSFAGHFLCVGCRHLWLPGRVMVRVGFGSGFGCSRCSRCAMVRRRDLVGRWPEAMLPRKQDPALAWTPALLPNVSRPCPVPQAYQWTRPIPTSLKIIHSYVVPRAVPGEKGWDRDEGRRGGLDVLVCTLHVAVPDGFFWMQHRCVPPSSAAEATGPHACEFLPRPSLQACVRPGHHAECAGRGGCHRDLPPDAARGAARPSLSAAHARERLGPDMIFHSLAMPRIY